MTYMMQKIKKGLFFPAWVVQMLDAEGEKFDGPGTVAGAAIHHLCGLSVKDRMAVIEAYRAAEVQYAYTDPDDPKLIAQAIEQFDIPAETKREMLAVLSRTPVSRSNKGPQKVRANKPSKAG